jgi:small subunit ribosomal protein S4
MGGIRKPKKKYVAPGHPWQKTRLADELIYVGEYGLRNKRELWRHRTMLARFRSTARDLVALPAESRGTRDEQLRNHVNRLALIDKKSQLDDILNLTIRDILERRLQTQVVRQGLAKSMHHARQLIVHGHIALENHRVTSPGMLMHRGQEKKLAYAPDSPYRQPNHPELPTGEPFGPPPKAIEEPVEKPDRVEVKIEKVREIKEVSLENEVDVEEEEPEKEEEQPPAKKKGAPKKKAAS